MDTHTYTGPALTSSVGEVLEAGDAVRVTFERDVLGVAIRGVDKASDAFGTGRTYTVWSVTAAELRPIGEAPAATPVPAGVSIWCRDCFNPATLVVSRVPFCDKHAELALDLVR